MWFLCHNDSGNTPHWILLNVKTWPLGLWYAYTNSNGMMTSSNGNIFRVTGPLLGETTSWSLDSSHKGQWRRALMFSYICTWTNGWANNRDAGDLRRHRVHFDVTVLGTIGTPDISMIKCMMISILWYLFQLVSIIIPIYFQRTYDKDAKNLKWNHCFWT